MYGYEFLWMILIWNNPVCLKASKYFFNKAQRNGIFTEQNECSKMQFEISITLCKINVHIGHRALFPFVFAIGEFKPFDLYLSWLNLNKTLPLHADIVCHFMLTHSFRALSQRSNVALRFVIFSLYHFHMCVSWWLSLYFFNVLPPCSLHCAMH